MKAQIWIMMTGVPFFSIQAVATFDAGQVYRVKQTVSLTKESAPATISSPEAVKTIETSETTTLRPHVAFWSIEKKEFQSANRVAPGLCEIQALVKSSLQADIKIPKKALYKFSSPMRSEDEANQTGLPLKNCLVFDGVSEGKKLPLAPEIQFHCCSEVELPTAASRQDFNQRIQDSLKPVLKLISEN
jgi:hypothetical protein